MLSSYYPLWLCSNSIRSENLSHKAVFNRSLKTHFVFVFFQLFKREGQSMEVGQMQRAWVEYTKSLFREVVQKKKNVVNFL
jgi:hypothetical protein